MIYFLSIRNVQLVKIDRSEWILRTKIDHWNTYIRKKLF